MLGPNYPLPKLTTISGGSRQALVHINTKPLECLLLALSCEGAIQ